MKGEAVVKNQEFFEKADIMRSVKDKLPESADILYGEIGDEVEIVLNDGIKEAARELGMDITWRNLFGSTWEASFMLDGVKISEDITGDR